MKNRESLYPGRIKLTPVDEANGIYDATRADEPQEEGTPLNKKLLDFAVAACGVTAGTSTAYTLDDEFGGFELVDGAKVNFRLHVASGANPTLNVNGTGAKGIMLAPGNIPATKMLAATWHTAAYDAKKDAFILEGESRVSIFTTESDAAAITIALPSESEIVKIRIHAKTTDSTNYKWKITSDIVFGACYTVGVSNGSAFGYQNTGYIGGGMISIYGGFFDITITRKDGYSYVHGLAGSNSTCAMFVTAPANGILSELTLTCGTSSFVFAAGAVIMTEVVA